MSECDIIGHINKQLNMIMYRLDHICEAVKTLEEQNKIILSKVDSMQHLNIENLEYKVNELKIDTLSGALNLGLTANADDVSVKKIIEKFEQDNCSIDVGNNKG